MQNKTKTPRPTNWPMMALLIAVAGASFFAYAAMSANQLVELVKRQRSSIITLRTDTKRAEQELHRYEQLHREAQSELPAIDMMLTDLQNTVAEAQPDQTKIRVLINELRRKIQRIEEHVDQPKATDVASIKTETRQE